MKEPICSGLIPGLVLGAQAYWRTRWRLNYRKALSLCVLVPDRSVSLDYYHHKLGLPVTGQTDTERNTVVANSSAECPYPLLKPALRCAGGSDACDRLTSYGLASSAGSLGRIPAVDREPLGGGVPRRSEVNVLVIVRGQRHEER